MVLDVIIGIIVIFSMVQGFRNGFVYTFIRMVGWLLAVVLGFVCSPYVKDFLLEKTDFYDSLHANLDEKFGETLSNADVIFNSLPKIIADGLDSFSGNVAESMATSLADVLFTIISFLVVVIGIKLILLLFISLISKRNNDGFTGALDGLLGLVAGFVKGMVLVFVLLALLVPVLSLVSPDMTQTVLDSLDSSYIAKDLYNNNLILLIVGDFLS